MKHTVLKTLCIVSGLFALANLIRLILGIVLLLQEMASGMGIIGGADTPTILFWLAWFVGGSSIFWWLLGSLAVFIVTLILLRKKK